QIKAIAPLRWANTTRAAYSTGLLVYYVFCDNKSVPKRDCAPASFPLISAFISCLIGSYSDRTMQNYVYGMHT
ncbi:hypothetical protein V8B97DRAFT_1877520, partial [Scleroderma yunnanense]